MLTTVSTQNYMLFWGEGARPTITERFIKSIQLTTPYAPRSSRFGSGPPSVEMSTYGATQS